MTFLESLREQVETRKSRRGRLLLKRLDRMRPARRKRVVARLEAHARAHLVSERLLSADAGAFDWSSINWGKVFDVLLQILMALLPFLLMLAPEPQETPRSKPVGKKILRGIRG